MGRYFGTDGFRGEAGRELTAKHAYKIGRVLGWLALKDEDELHTHGRPRIIIGKDTRRSGYMLESALSAGITASGVDAYMMYVTTTPSVAYITRTEDFRYGVMISASHNPFQDNGIKVLSADGEKLDEETIAKIEDALDASSDEIPYAQGDKIGITKDYSACRERYAGYLIGCPDERFFNRRVGLDCANGGSYMLAKQVFEALGAETHVIHYAPNGLNINVDCGSTHMESLCEFVRNNGLDCGFAFDGDADRCLAVDENGNEINGDQILYVTATAMKAKGRLKNNTVVTTIMSNFGLYKALERCGIDYEKTKVGDKYVWENMQKNGHALGGEQSGHVIFGDYARTGDGILTALMVMQVMLETNKPLSELVAPCVLYPQVLKNVRVDDKEHTMEDAAVKAAVASAGEALGDSGRVLVRPSGTEPVVRVMAEALDADTCEQHVDSIIAAMQASGHVV